MDKRKRLQSSRSKSRVSQFNEPLERRLMMAAQAAASIPAQALVTGTTPAAINLSTYLNDSVIPSGDTVIEMHTSLPAPNNVFPMLLTTNATPHTVANFISYITSGEYTNSIIHRSVPGFVIQGGGYNTSGSAIPSTGKINGEASTEVLHNVAGTIAMALSTGPDSATNEWFYNLADNSSLLDGSNDGGPFTVFGNVIYNGMTAIDAIAAVPVYNASSSNGAWDNLPLQNFSGGSFASTNFVAITPVVNSSPITYSVTNTAPGKVTAAITNGSLQLTPVATGTASITITATDLAGGTASETIPVTITAAGVPVVSVASAAGTVGTNSAISFPVTLSTTAAAAVTLSYTTVAGSAASGDFTPTTGTLTIPAGSTSGTVSVPIVKDTTNAAETFTLKLSSLSGNATFSGGATTLSATGTIQAVAGTPTVTIGSASGTIGTDSQITFPVTLSTAATASVTVNYTTVAGTAVDGDFTTTNGTLVIPAGSLTGHISVGIQKDTAGASESFTVQLSSLSGNAVFSGSASTISGTGTILPSGVTAADPTVTTLTASAQSLVLNGTDTFTAKVVTTAGAPVTTGSVTFAENGVTVGTAAVGPLGAATFTQAFTSTANLSVTALYTGDGATFADSTSSPVLISVTTLTPATLKSTVPASIVAGNTASGSTTVSVGNSTADTVKGAITVSVYASTDGLIDGSSILIGTARKSVKLATGKSANIGLGIKTKAGLLPAGTYTLLSQTKDVAGNLSAASTGPTLTVAAASVVFTPVVARVTGATSVVAGTKTKAAAVVSIKNTGNFVSTSPLTISLYASPDGTVASGTLIRTVTVKSAIKPGKSASVSVAMGSYPSVTNGSYSIVANVTDAAGHTAAAASASPITIAAAFVDLAATATTISKTAVTGKSATVSVTFTNNGNVNATGSVPMLVQLSATPDGANPVTVDIVPVKVNLPAGKKQSPKFKVTVPATLTAGTYYLVTTVDNGNVLSEPGLADNTVVSLATVSVT